MFDRLFRRERKSVTIDGYELLTGTGSATVAGVAVSAESAMRCSTAFACIRIIAETIQQVPVRLYHRDGDDRVRATDHPVYPLVTKSANPWTPASEFRLVMATHLAVHGNAYAWVNRAGDGAVREMILLDPRRVAVKQDPRTMAPVYTVTWSDGTAREFDRTTILHVRGPGLDPLKGDSPVMLAKEAIGLHQTLELHCAGLFGRGAKPSGVIKAKGPMKPDVFARLAQSFSSWYSGTANAGKTMILEDDMSFEPLQLTSADAQTLELRRHQVAEVSRFWRVPLSLLNDLERVTHANAESLAQQFLTFCMLPVFRSITDAMAITLLTPEERETLYFEFTTDALVQADLAQRMAAYAQAIASGVLNPNEARARENLAGYAGGGTFMRPVNQAPAPSQGGTDAAL